MLVEKIEWNDKYLLGIPTIDTQHKKLVSLINELYDTIQVDGETYCIKISLVLKELVDYTLYHFAEEEALVAQYEYPTADFHKMQHGIFVKEVSMQVERLANSKPEDGLKFYDYLLTWLLSHIAKSDKAWALFILPKMNEKA